MSLYFHSQIYHAVPYLLPLEILFPFLLLPITNIPTYHHVSLSPISLAWVLKGSTNRLAFITGWNTLYSPQLSDLLMRIYMPSGLQHHQWIHVCLLARNCLYCDWQLPSRETRAFWGLLYLFHLESYLRKILGQSGMIYSHCFLSCSCPDFPDFDYLFLKISSKI